jgi:hypothetical protein
MSTLLGSTLLSDFAIPFGIDGALIFFSGFRVLLWSRITRAPAMPARAAPPATSGIFAFEATCATLPPALLGAARLPLAAPRAFDFARDAGAPPLERFPLAWLRLALRVARLPFELRRRDREEAFVLDEPLRLELRLLPERLPDDLVPWAIFQASLSLPCGHGFIPRPSEPEWSYPEGAFACAHTPLKTKLHGAGLFGGDVRRGGISRAERRLGQDRTVAVRTNRARRY